MGRPQVRPRIRDAVCSFAIASLATLLIVAMPSAAGSVYRISVGDTTGPDALAAISPKVSEGAAVIVYTEYDASRVGEQPWPDCSGGRPTLHLPCSQLVRVTKDERCRVSRHWNGDPLQDLLTPVSMDRTGTILAYGSHDPDVVPGDTNGIDDGFVTRGCEPAVRVTVSSDGRQAEPLEDAGDQRGHPCRLYCVKPVASGNGAWVAYSTWSANLDVRDTNAWPDVFVHELATRKTTALSRAADGATADGPSYLASDSNVFSEDGRRVVFLSMAKNLVPGPLPECPQELDKLPPSYALTTCPQAYLAEAGTVTLISATPAGEPSDSSVNGAAISGDGRYVFFSSRSTRMLAAADADPSSGQHIFRKTLADGTLTLVTVEPDGRPAAGTHRALSVSYDGQRVAFLSDAASLVNGDTNDGQDVFVRDLAQGLTVRASMTSDGKQLPGGSEHANISPDGLYVVWTSTADGIVADDHNGVWDVYRTDLAPLLAGETVDTTETAKPAPWPAFPVAAGLLIFAALVRRLQPL